MWLLTLLISYAVGVSLAWSIPSRQVLEGEIETKARYRWIYDVGQEITEPVVLQASTPWVNKRPQSVLHSDVDRLTPSPVSSAFWYETITHNGQSPNAPNGDSWKVFRNVVTDYGADNTGRSDATKAITAAINDGSSSGVDRTSNKLGTTNQPAVVYLPAGTYTISSPLQLYVGTVLMGNPLGQTIIKASSDFKGPTMIWGKDPNQDATTNFYIAIKNLIIDSTAVDKSTTLSLLDWSVSQATQLTNVIFNMPNFSTGHTGIVMPEGGSGTMMGDLTFNGGAVGLNMNNQQYEGKSMTFNACTTGIKVDHCFDCVFTNCTFTHVGTGLDMTGGSVGSIVLLDSTASDSGTVVNTNSENSGDHTLVIENFSKGSGISSVVSAGGTSVLNDDVPDTWVYGNTYTTGGPPSGSHQTGTTYKVSRASSLLSDGKYLTLPPPTYGQYDVSQFVNVKSVDGLPVQGDGKTDDTKNLNAIISKYAGSKILFFPQGTYIVTDTIVFPDGSRVVGEAWSAISALGSKFFNPKSPVPMVRVGSPGDKGVAQFSDMLFTVADVLQGCILLEVNMAGKNPGDVAFWNTHFRVGGAAGSKVETNCGGSPASCKAAFALMHLTPSSSAYIENMWGWTADHDLDGGNGQNIATGRGFLVEATSATWLHGTAAEHNTLYQYNFNNAANVFVGMQQSETPYWQGNGAPALAPDPWTPDSSFGDPDFSNCAQGDGQCRMAWFARISGCSNMFFYGAGFWTFFNNGDGSCQGDGVCQTNAINIRNTTSISWFGINTKDNVNVIDNDGVALVTENNNPGGPGGFGKNGAVVGAFLQGTLPGVPLPPVPPPGKYEQAVYWGQNDAEKDLGAYCQANQGIDIIVLSFLATYGNGKAPSGNFGECTIDQNGNGQGCGSVAAAIQACQSAGKKVLISLGGGGASGTVASQGDAEGIAFTLWNSYANPKVSSGAPRPFGDVYVNGFDLDIESNPNGNNQNYKYLVNKLRSFFPTDTQNSYYISGAPQCPLPEANMGDAIDNAKFDYVFIQFYNNDYCSAYQFVRRDNGRGDGFNFDVWESSVASHASAGAKLLVGLPASPLASTGGQDGAKYFLNPSELATLVNAFTSHTGFGGVMLWDAGNSDSDTNGGCTYDQEVRSVLDTGRPC